MEKKEITRWDDEAIIWHRAEPNKVDCKDCIHRQKNSVISGNCAIYRGRTLKPSDILLANAKCSYKISEKKFFGNCKKAATQGDPEMMYELAKCYHDGIGTQKDETKALFYAEESAKCGFVRANVAMGHYYLERGEDAKSYPYFRRAAEGGSAHGLYVLAQLTRDGTGTKADAQKALPMFQKAAEMGNHDAICEMGYIYEDGTLVKQNYEKAATYYWEAVKAGNILACVNLGLAYASGRGVDQDFHMAGKLFKSAADANDPAGLYYYGTLFLSDDSGFRKSYKRALGYIQRAADLGEGYAYNALSVMYEKGLGVKKDGELAKKYHKLAVEADCVEELDI